MRDILDIQLRRLQPRLERRELTLEVTEAAREALAIAGYDAELGARPLKRLIQQTVVDSLARGILEGRFAPGQTVVVDHDQSATNESPLDVPALTLRCA